MVSTQLSDHVQVFWPKAVFAKFQARGGPNTLVDLDVSARSSGDLTALPGGSVPNIGLLVVCRDDEVIKHQQTN